MSISEIVISRAQDALENLGGDWPMEDIVGRTPDLTCNQVIMAINHLSRVKSVLISARDTRTLPSRACQEMLCVVAFGLPS